MSHRQTVTGRAFFRVEHASGKDASEIHAIAFKTPDKHIKRLTVLEVEQLVDDGMFWIARDTYNEKIVGVCYIKVPMTEAGVDPDPAEYGGVFVNKTYRRKGIGTLLANVSISRYFWDNTPDISDPIPLIAHVHVHNAYPRNILQRLGFRFKRQVIVPDKTPGFEHMPKDEDGKIHGDEFTFDPKKRVSLFRTVAQLLCNRQIQAADGSIIELEYVVGAEFSSEALLELAEQLESI